MGVVASRRSVMTLFSGDNDPYSHRVRIVLAEKGINVDIVSVEAANLPEDLIDLNPYNSVPTLVDRELVLYGSAVIMEYLDERFPHPPLMPVDPVSRATNRLMLYRIEQDLYRHLDLLADANEKVVSKAKKEIRENLVMASVVFESKPYFLSDEFSLVDCALAPLLWRLPHYGISLPKQAAALLDYADRIFARESFRESLTEQEREMRD
ncbi:MAG: glutathione S-transferase N-terminal domain-containing protein [Chromatiales bacterium]|nr:glutathione S-transferase N-terminal domain-containing protein [Gammaproteobacteria bacterium]MBW6476238.1 glutathione S-transferase N-terminal domain-containing protein [Chromatiales bacterium]